MVGLCWGVYKFHGLGFGFVDLAGGTQHAALANVIGKQESILAFKNAKESAAAMKGNVRAYFASARYP